MLLLVLLVILLAAERRAELGISRALGLQRGHLVQLLLFEGCGYALIAALIGLLLGMGVTALELRMFSLLPRLGIGEAANAVPISVITVGSLSLSLTWQSELAAGCLGVLTNLLTVLAAALWISRTPIDTAIRDLDASPAAPRSLLSLGRAFLAPPAERNMRPIQKRLPGGVRARQKRSLGWSGDSGSAARCVCSQGASCLWLAADKKQIG